MECESENLRILWDKVARLTAARDNQPDGSILKYEFNKRIASLRAQIRRVREKRKKAK